MSNSCECGICDHHSEVECIEKECKCCLGPKVKQQLF
jgi:hypothetical protein